MQIVTREPIGVIACIIPFNFPCDLYDQKVAPALMMGNAALVLPSSDNPLTLMKLTEMLVEAGVPDGVIQCVTAPGAVKSTAVADPRVHLVTLTGSTEVGIDTAKIAAGNLTHTALELGGNDAFIVLDDGDVARIVEQKDATEEERKINEVNSGIYCFECQDLFAALAQVGCDNAQGEYYLPDVLGILRDKGEKIWAVAADDYESTLGINSRLQLSGAEKILRRRKNIELMNNGVTLMDPDSTFVDADVEVGSDTVIYPFTWLEAGTVVGAGCEIGPNSRFSNAKIGNDVHAQFAYGHDCIIDDGVTMGPYVHIRPNSHIHNHVKIGNFVEVKNSQVGEGTKLPHLQYIGDADVGANVNLGCGTVTVNYDGKKKFRTTIGDNAFVGCNTSLVAPVEVGDGAYIGAGSVITKNVPGGTLAIGRARQKLIEGWTDKRK